MNETLSDAGAPVERDPLNTMEWRDMERRIAYCAYCPKMCRFVCPPALENPSEVLHPTGKADLLLRVLKGRTPLTKEAAEVFYQCTGCLSSRTYCDHDIAVYPSLEAARAMVVERGDRSLLPEGVLTALDSLAEWGNSFQRDLSGVMSEHVPEERVEPGAQVLVFAGCATLHYDPEVLSALVRILDGLELDFVGFPGNEALCCGGAHLDLGDRAGFQAAAQTLYPKLAAAKTVVTLCPHCAYTFKSEYGRFDPGFSNRIVHVSSFLLGYRDRFPKRAKTGSAPVTYHDPCYLGRYLGIYDDPRRLLQTALPENGVLEFPMNRERAECCGGGGGLPLVFPESAKGIAERRLKAAPETSGPLLSACPWCVGLFRKAVGLFRQDGAEREVTDVVTWIARVLFQ